MTYCITQTPRLTIQLFTEKPGDSGSPHLDTTTKSRQLAETQSPIEYLDLLPYSLDTQDEFVLLSVHENGQIRLFSEDLDQEYHDFNVSGLGPQKDPFPNLKTTCARVIATETAQENLLLGRGDIGAKLQSGSERAISKALMVLSKVSEETQEEGQRGETVLVFHLLRVTYDFSHARGSRLGHPNVSCEEILSSTLIVPEAPTEIDGDWSFDESGSLYYQDSASFTCYKFNGQDMRIHNHVGLDIPTESCLRLGSANIATTSKSTISFIDTVHKSLLSRQVFHRKGSKQSQREPEENKPTFRLCSYFATLQLMVAIHGRALVVIPAGGFYLAENARRKRQRNGTLIDSAGRGWNRQHLVAAQPVDQSGIPQSSQTIVSTEGLSKSWEQTQPELQRHVKARNFTKFDEVLSDVFQLKKLRPPQAWDQARRASCLEIQWILGQIFHLETQLGELGVDSDSAPMALKVGFLPPKTFKWLIDCGAMSSQQVELALKASDKMAVSMNLPHDGIIGAFSSSLVNSPRHLSHLVSSKCLLSPDEVVHALRYALDRIETYMTGLPQRIQISSDRPPENIEIDSAEYSNTLEEKIYGADRKIAYSLIKNCLSRLHPLDAQIIRRSLKSNLRSSHLITLIDCLRLDLARGGWLSQFSTEDDPTPPPPKEHLECLIQTSRPNESIHIITKLLNCTLDALGTTAWISAPSTSETNGYDRSDMLTFMKAEVSAALEAIEEAAYLDGVLSQVLLYSHRAAETVTKNGKPHRKDSAKRDFEYSTEKKWKQKGGAVITQDDETLKDPSLPLDLQLAGEKEISDTKVGTGGVLEKRSVREQEYLRRRQVGEYQFERIIF